MHRGYMTLLFLLHSSCLALAVEPSPMIGWRHDGTGVFPADCRPVAEWDQKTGKNIVWRAPLPNHGNGSPIVVGTKAFVVVEPGFPEGNDAPLLMCFDAHTGKVLWQAAVDPFTTLPATKRKELTELRAQYWKQLRAYNVAANRARSGEQQAFAEMAQLRLLKHTTLPRLIAKLKKDAQSKEGLLTKFGHKTLLAEASGELHKYGFKAPSWNWTGMGITMPTPVSDGKRVYVVTGQKTFAAYTLDGKQEWIRFFKDVWGTGNMTELMGNAPLLVDGKLVAWIEGHLFCLDPATGKDLWVHKIPMPKAHIMGTPQVLRLPVAGGVDTVTAIFTAMGLLVRLDDGHIYADDIGLLTGCASVMSNGKDTIYGKAVGGGGIWLGRKPEFAERRFLTEGTHAIRFILKNRDELLAEQVWAFPKKVKVPGIGGVAIIMDGKAYNGGGICDLSNGQNITPQVASRRKKEFRMGYYNGQIYAGGLFIGSQKAGPHSKTPTPDSDRFASCVYRNDTFEMKQNLLNRVPDPEAGEVHQRCVLEMTGQFARREWYGWHSSYSTPFASGNRLFIRTYEYLYCIGKKDEPFIPSRAFLPR